MASCPCCLEELKPALLGRRRLAGDCEICGERVCDACLRAPTLRAQVFRSRPTRPSEHGSMVKGVACTSCLWDLLAERGVTPPFPEPAGHRVKAAQERCEHPRLVRWMRCCPDCGAEEGWDSEPDAPSCDACGAPSHELFNACWSCGESFEEENDPAQAPVELGLDPVCGARGCTGRVAWPMPHCPWCASALGWPHTKPALGVTCVRCDAALDPTWAHCIGCGAEAPPPDRCIECGERLEHAACAARCDECRHLVCGDCFGTYTVSEEEALLCVSCADSLGAVPVEEPAAEPEPAASDEDASDPDPQVEAAPPDDDSTEAPDAESDAEAAEEAQAAADEADAQRERAATGDPQTDQTPPPAEESPSAWEILGVEPGAPLAEIRRAYLKLVAQYHPDKVAQLGPKLQALALEETRRLNEAFDTLRTQAART